jgi:class 3 adenylate cyclase
MALRKKDVMKAPRRFNPQQILDAHEWRKSVAIALAFAAVLLLANSFDWLGFLAKERINAQDVHIWRFMPPTTEKTEIIVLTCLLGAAIATVLHPLMFWFSLALMICALVVVSMSYYSYESFGVWWLFPVFGMIGSGSTVFGLKEIKLRQVVLKVRINLESMLPPWILQKVLADPRSLNIVDRKVTATVVVIDVSGLSALCENHALEDVVAGVRALSHVLRATVHRFGGVIMPSYREGFVCIFGDLFHEGSTLTWHAEYALQCMSEVQRTNARTMLAAAAEKRPVLALRIGVTSARVNIGNLGRTEAFDFALFGSALDEARTYERTCDTNTVLFSRATRDMLVKLDRNAPMLSKRVVAGNFGHNGDKIEAYELDPFHDVPALRRDATRVWREALKLIRNEERWPIKNPGLIRVLTSIGPGKPYNVSVSGMALLLDQAVPPGTSMRLKFESDHPALKARLENRELAGVNAVVIWAKPSGQTFLHGLEYKDIPRADREFLLQCVLGL